MSHNQQSNDLGGGTKLLIFLTCVGMAGGTLWVGVSILRFMWAHAIGS